MSIWQGLLIVLFLGAVLAGRPRFPILVVLPANFAASALLSNSVDAVAVADIAAGAALVFGHGRERAIAAIFAIMAVFEYTANILLAAPDLIYTVTTVLAGLQCGVIGGADRGLGHFLHHSGRRTFDSGRGDMAILLSGHDAGQHMARDPAQDGG